MDIIVNTRIKHSIYKQIVEQVERGVRDGSLSPGEQLPSMNVLADKYKISRETVKKAYGILVEKDIIEPLHGKGFYVKDLAGSGARIEVLVILDNFSVYKQITYTALAQTLGPGADITILNHDQNPDLLEYFIDSHLDSFDYYVIAPHFPTTEEVQKRVTKLLSRIPVRKLILIDHIQPGLRGRFGAVYQDFENDIYEGLEQGIESISKIRRFRVITLPRSLYGETIHKGIDRFAGDNGIPVEFLTRLPDSIERGDAFLLLNSQLDSGLVALSRMIQESGLEIGKGVFIISYNEYPMNELILGGLTTVSTDFPEMGQTAARMILDRKMNQIHNRFVMTRRRTF